MAQARTLTIESPPSGQLAARMWGDGERHALLLHGSTSSSATWWRIGPELASDGWSVTALDLPSHGRSAALSAPLDTAEAARSVAATIGDRHFDLVVGHSFGAATAVELLSDNPGRCDRWVLEELPGRRSLDWRAEADAVLREAAEARADPDAAIARVRSQQPRWHETDCQYDVHALLACAVDDVAAGFRGRAGWPEPVLPPAGAHRVLLLLATDAEGETSLRGAERESVRRELRADVHVLDAGHCVHRDDPDGWLSAVRAFVDS
jgi:pimeloyl-ACP methyl ester carboxylesterase